MKKLLFFAVFLLLSEILPAGEPFHWHSDFRDGLWRVSVQIAPGCYLYADQTAVQFRDAAGKTVSPVKKAAGILEKDDFSGETISIFPAGKHVWECRTANPGEVRISCQGCRKASGDKPGSCFLPQTLTLNAVRAPAKPGTPGKTELFAGFQTLRVHEGTANAEGFLQFLNGTEPSAKSAMPGNTAFWLLCLLTLLGGTALNLTPCVLPMIPINLAIIGAGSGTSRAAGFRRGLFYGLGMTLSYGALGLAVVLFGVKFGSLNSSSIFNFAVAAVFVLLALAMAGVFRLDFSGKMSAVRPNAIPGGKTFAALILGGLSALLAGACVAPVVIGTLLLAGKFCTAGNYRGLLLPFLLGAGMALPWPLAGAGLAILPKPGRFMVKIKYAFAILILCAAGYYAYLGVTLLPGKYSEPAELQKLQSALQESRRTKRPLLIEFSASWCKNCAAMKRSVLPQEKIQNALKNFVFTEFQAEKLSSPATAQILDHFHVQGLPAFVILQTEP